MSRAYCARYSTCRYKDIELDNKQMQETDIAEISSVSGACSTVHVLQLFVRISKKQY